MTTRRTRIGLTIVAVLLFGIQASAQAVQALRADLERIFASPLFKNAEWGIKVVSLENAEVLYEKGPELLKVPASNNKLLVAAAALSRLGPEYRLKTHVAADGVISDGILKGNLVIVGSGDPGVAPRFQGDDPFAMFKKWAGQLKNLGIRGLEGKLLGDDRAIETPGLGMGWEWNDLVFGYAAPAGALQFDDNQISVEVRPGKEIGTPAVVSCRPLPGYLSVETSVVTGPVGSDSHLEFERGESKESLRIGGTIPLKSPPIVQSVAVQLPTRYYLEGLRKILIDEGVDLSRAQIGRFSADAPVSVQDLWVEPSPPLAEMVRETLKASQNMYAETLVRILGLEFRNEGSFEKGKEVVQEFLDGCGIPEDSYSYADASGLSRLNLLSADGMIRLLASMHRQPAFQSFYDALPIAGVDGTLAARMKGTKAEGNVRAKSGSMSNSRAISGYLSTVDNELVAFSILVNHFIGPGKAAESLQDAALIRLSGFSRKQQAAGSRQQAAGSRQQAAGSRQQAAGSRQQAAGSRQQAAGSRQQAAGSRQQAAGSRQQAAGSRQQAAGSRQQAAGSRQQAAGSRQLEDGIIRN